MDFNTTGRGIAAAEDIPPSELIVQIPLSICISAETINKTEFAKFIQPILTSQLGKFSVSFKSKKETKN